MPQIVIIGGGLSGLYAAFLLERRRLDYVLLEARERLGGRIESLPSTQHGFEDTVGLRPAINRFDVGAAWYWPAMQPHLVSVLKEIGLQGFEQYEKGDMLVERSPLEPPLRVGGDAKKPASMRLVGGMSSFVEGLTRHLSPARLRMRMQVRSIAFSEGRLTITATNPDGERESIKAASILLAVPPRLAATAIEFTPPLPSSLQRDWAKIGTWMASHAKYVATFQEAFWRRTGLSGEAQSSVGPLAEIYDSSAIRGNAALFGFLRRTADERVPKSNIELKADCREHLIRLFGPAAASPKDEFLRDWAREPFTATQEDQHAGLHQAEAPSPLADAGAWQHRLVGIASEWSPQFPGYIAGAVDAATRGVMALEYL